MPTKQARVQVTLEPLLYRWVKAAAEDHGLSLSQVIRDWVKALRDHELEEDLMLGKIAQARLHRRHRTYTLDEVKRRFKIQ